MKSIVRKFKIWSSLPLNCFHANKTEKSNFEYLAFIAGDADALDTQSDRISKSFNMHIVSINYKLAKDGITKEYVLL